jgi:hypothetical protein
MKLGRQRVILTALAALAIALFTEIFLPLNWTTARCGTGALDQPYAAYGIPLPHMMWSGVSSIEFDYLPWILSFNLAALTGAVFAVLRKFPFFGSGWNLVWICPATVIGYFLIWVPLSFPVEALGGAEPITLLDFRPVGIGQQGYECTASPYWFSSKPHQTPSRAR